MRIIVIDDEPRQRKGMEELVRNIRGGDEVCSFKDGEQALAYAREYAVDIVFSDIRMPKMTGLEFAAQLLVIRPEAVLILVSVYADFEYAQKAIEYGAFGYILKPVSVESVQEILDKAVRKINERKKQFSSEHRLFMSALSVYQEHLVKKWVTGGIEPEEEKELMDFLPEKKEGYMVYLCLAGMEDLDSGAEVMTGMMEWLRQYLKPGMVCCFSEDANKHTVVAIVFWDGSDSDFEMSLARFRRNMEKEYRERLFLIRGRRFIGVHGDVQKAFLELKDDANILFYGIFPETYAQRLPRQTDKLSAKIMEQKELVIRYVSALDAEMAERKMEDMFLAFVQEPVLKPHIMTGLISHMFLQILDNISEFLTEDVRDMLAKESIALKMCASYAQIREKAGELLQKSICCYQEGRENLSPIHQAICYINDHYQEELSLNMLAEKFHYSPNYFSAIFKNTAGENLVAYINRVRIEKAMDYMGIDAMKNHEIASKVGIKDYKYFNRIFKKRYGVSIQEFRRKLRAEREKPYE